MLSLGDQWRESALAPLAWHVRSRYMIWPDVIWMERNETSVGPDAITLVSRQCILYAGPWTQFISPADWLLMIRLDRRPFILSDVDIRSDQLYT